MPFLILSKHMVTVERNPPVELANKMKGKRKKEGDSDAMRKKTHLNQTIAMVSSNKKA